MYIARLQNPSPLVQKTNDLATQVYQNCSVTQNSNQTVICDITAVACPDLNIQCGNAASQIFTCSEGIPPTVIQDTINGEDVDALNAVLGLPYGSTTDVIQQKIQSVINQTCSGSQQVDQTIYEKLVCVGASGIGATIMNSVDQKTGCSLGYLTNIVTQARQVAADTYNRGVKQRIIAYSVVIGIVVLGIGLTVLLAIGLNASCKRVVAN